MSIEKQRSGFFQIIGIFLSPRVSHKCQICWIILSWAWRLVLCFFLMILQIFCSTAWNGGADPNIHQYECLNQALSAYLDFHYFPLCYQRGPVSFMYTLIHYNICSCIIPYVLDYDNKLKELCNMHIASTCRNVCVWSFLHLTGEWSDCGCCSRGNCCC